jgi:hypothetical protein
MCTHEYVQCLKSKLAFFVELFQDNETIIVHFMVTNLLLPLNLALYCLASLFVMR